MLKGWLEREGAHGGEYQKRRPQAHTSKGERWEQVTPGRSTQDSATFPPAWLVVPEA